MADPARKPRPNAEPAAAPPAPTRPQLRPRAIREADADAPRANEPQRLQQRVAAAFSGKTGSTLENTLMRLIIVAATCLVVLTTAREGGLLR